MLEIPPNQTNQPPCPLELVAALYQAVEDFKEDASQIPFGKDFNPFLIGLELKNIGTRKLSEIFPVIDKWSDPSFWEGDEMVAKRLLEGATFAFIDSNGGKIEAEHVEDESKYTLLLSDSPWFQFKKIKEQIFIEKPQTLFFIGEEIRKGNKVDSNLKILIEAYNFTNNDVKVHQTSDAAKRALSILICSESITTEDVPENILREIKTGLFKFRLLSAKSRSKQDVIKDEHIKTLLELHPSDVPPSLYTSIASDNKKLEAAYDILRGRLNDPKTDIDIRVELLDKYLALNQSLLELLPKKGSEELSLDFKFLLSNPDIYRDIAKSFGLAAMLGGYQTAKMVRLQLQSKYLKDNAAEFLVIAGTLDASSPLGVELYEALLEKEIDIETACEIANRVYGSRVSEVLRKGIQDLKRKIENGDSFKEAHINLFQMAPRDKSANENAPIKVFRPNDRNIFDDSVELVTEILSKASNYKLLEQFLENSAELEDSLRTRLADEKYNSRITRWAKSKFSVSLIDGKSFYDRNKIDLDHWKKAWCVYQLAFQCLPRSPGINDKTRESFAKCCADIFIERAAKRIYSSNDDKKRYFNETRSEPIKLLSNIISIFSKPNRSNLDELFIRNIKEFYRRFDLNAAVTEDEILERLFLNSENNIDNDNLYTSAAKFNDYYDKKELRFYIAKSPDLGLYPPDAIHRTSIGDIAEIRVATLHNNAMRNFVRLVNLDKLSEPNIEIENVKECVWIKDSYRNPYAVFKGINGRPTPLIDLVTKEVKQLGNDGFSIVSVDLQVFDPKFKYIKIPVAEVRGSENNEMKYDLIVSDLESGEPVKINGSFFTGISGSTNSSISNIFRSPNGKREYAIGHVDNKLSIVDLTNRRIVSPENIEDIICCNISYNENGEEISSNVSFSKDGKRAFAVVKIDGVYKPLCLVTGKVYNYQISEASPFIYFGGKDNNSPIIVCGDSESSKIIDLYTGYELYRCSRPIGSLYEIDISRKLSSDIFRVFVHNNDAHGSPDNSYHIFNIKLKSEIAELKGIERLLDLYENREAQELFYMHTGQDHSVHSSPLIRLSNTGRLICEYSDYSVTSNRQVKDKLSSDRELANIASQMKDISHISRDVKGNGFFIVGRKKESTPKEEIESGVYYFDCDKKSLSLMMAKRGCVAAYPYSSGKTKYIGFESKSIQKISLTDFHSDSFSNIDVIDSTQCLFANNPNGPDQFLIVKNAKKISTGSRSQKTVHAQFEIYEISLPPKKIQLKDQRIVEVEQPILSDDGSRCLLKYQYLDSQDNLCNSTLVLWWNNEGIEGYTKDEIRKICLPNIESSSILKRPATYPLFNPI